MDIKKIPNLKETKEIIKKIQENGFPIYNGETVVEDYVKIISNILLDSFGFIISYKQFLKKNEFLPRFYRVRELDAISNINLIREHSYPPINFVSMGRCNFPKYPVFYCSDNPLTALIEVARNDKKTEKKYCISKWEIIHSDEDLVFENFLQTELPIENQYRAIKESINQRISIPFEISFNKKLDNDKIEGLTEYMRFLDNCFINDNEYSISASLSHNSLYANHNLRTDILMYPSVQTLCKGVNFAIQPNFVENNLKLTRLYIMSLEDYNPNKNIVKVEMNEYAVIDKNVIMWKKIYPDNYEYLEFVKQDFGDMITGNFTKKQ